MVYFMWLLGAGTHAIKRITEVEGELKKKLSAVLKDLKEKKERGCYNIKSALQNLSEAEFNVENIEKEIAAQTEVLVSSSWTVKLK